MCEPTTWVMIGIALVGGAMQYDASKKSQKFQEEVAEQNTKVANAQATDAERLGQIEASERRLKTRMQIATQTVGFGANNSEVTGTSLDILGETAMWGEVDETRIKNNADRQAWGYRVQAHGIQVDKRMMQFNEKNNRTGTILSTASGVAGAYAGYLSRRPPPKTGTG